ncbi:MAG: NADH-quinone oxidoreductase subunit A [Bryobacteraceae bacterium]
MVRRLQANVLREQFSEARETVGYGPLAAYFGLTVLLAAGILGASYVLGERHREPATRHPYEAGVASAGSARVRLSARFFLLAMFFVIFDLEAIFLFAWAVAARELGWSAYWEVVVFVGILGATLAYLWRVGGLDWTPPREDPKGARSAP